ncbi:MotA/TolQ/ExbB proton channel family protein [Campylobacter sp. LMG 7929]|uniref:MotA/TolQ/ExbB proton channel family protein n=1 Tax=unclassified Campylobacter TaxID=2593542 RepID=UPI00128906C7|nr:MULTISPECIES: MotA/TolQ/ExbB proton channel family protein [unclassified Campylobacter]EAH4570720.1 MotA/TolQ/ExbB proton channel family protein [Campylobacter lari]MCR8682793.1 MotA/TolQ/ExbB proton channel family protein [Campylobacter sp. LMG 17559]MCR8697745.1 MotA/TolQ/ExbB proton channel family protein [Campylobacter sp. LMG 7929]MCR8705274.1 MotA/TolQ/ExbB proton channel family protein [Campylobacter sp. 2352 PW]EAH6868625.1 MotA/TolQ/ExbB proton channel family protein [Campylobacter
MDFQAIFHFFENTSLITYIVLAWLSVYFILSFSILFSRLMLINKWTQNESQALEALMRGEKDLSQSASILKKCVEVDETKMNIYKNSVEKKATIGLTWLSIIASTSPFIGLFGTVISILETFGGLEMQNSLSIIAPKISEALVATGCGILVAIPAYSFHLIIKRKAYELINILDSEIKVLVSSIKA